jgi:KUP system potassium uptake protein
MDAINPYYAVIFFRAQGMRAWALMGSVVLCVTGCEAMYADMGHFGKNSVRASWLFIVYPSLVLNYLGQVFSHFFTNSRNTGKSVITKSRAR